MPTTSGPPGSAVRDVVVGTTVEGAREPGLAADTHAGSPNGTRPQPPAPADAREAAMSPSNRADTRRRDSPPSPTSQSAEGPERRNEPDRLDWAEPLTDEERQALEAGWSFLE